MSEDYSKRSPKSRRPINDRPNLVVNNETNYNSKTNNAEMNIHQRKNRVATPIKTSRSSSDSDSSSSDEEVEDNGGSSNTEQNPFGVIMFCIIILAIGILAYFMNIVNGKQATFNISYLRENFKKQDNETWNCLEAVIDDVLSLNPVHPAVFLFIYTGDNNIVNNMVESIANYASTKLDAKEKFIDVNGNEFHSEEALQDYGHLLVKYKPLLEKKQVMVVKDLQNIPASVAQVFHSFCDEINPQVERAVFIFTLKVNSLDGRPVDIAENVFETEWSELNIDTLMPLITRITSTVLKVRS